MKFTVNVKINDRQSVSAEFDGKMLDVLKGANALLSYDGKCGLCGKSNIVLQTRVAKGYTFPEFSCRDCGARANWGQYKEGGYFLKNWDKYQPEYQPGDNGDITPSTGGGPATGKKPDDFDF